MTFKKAAGRNFCIVCLSIFFFSLITGCSQPEPPPVTPDPHAGQVLVEDGRGNYVWVRLHEELAVNRQKKEAFSSGGNYIEYVGDSSITLRGIDVSFYQGDIDWAAVAEDGVEFAIIRAGYRGYTTGNIFEDEKFRQNIDGAIAAGLKTGVYFFSQAINEAEAVEEAEFVLELIRGYELDLPVMFDWEQIGASGDDVRTEHVSGETLTNSCIAFCETIAEAGFKPGVYFYRDLGYNEYELGRLDGLTFWVGALGDYPDFYYKHDIWQYSISGRVAGIEGDVDLNIYFYKTIGLK